MVHIRPLRRKRQKLDSWYKTENKTLASTIKECAQSVCENAKNIGYIEVNFRKLLTRELRKRDLEVYEEVPVIYRSCDNLIPFGHGFVDIAVMDNNRAILLELKTTKKTAIRQLKKYMKHWDYSAVSNGFTVNFYDDEVQIENIKG